ncbi:MAG: hypothetical protein U0401_14425 [Anaerolineae bacterium]
MSKQLTKARLPLPTRPGDVAKYDYEYERNGTSNLFIFSPLWKPGGISKLPFSVPSLISLTVCGIWLTFIFLRRKIVVVMDNEYS